MDNIMQLITDAISNKADNIIFSVDNGIGKLLIKYNISYSEDIISYNNDESLIIANSFTQWFEENLILDKRDLSKIFNIKNTNYKIDYQLIVTDINNFNIHLKIKNTNKILFNRQRVETSALILLEKILVEAIQKNTCDIHIQIRDTYNTNQVKVMFRAHGNLSYYEDDKITLQQGYALCKTMHNITENKEIDNNETEDFMNVFYKSIHYQLVGELYKFGVGINTCYPKGLDMIIRVLPIDTVFLE